MTLEIDAAYLRLYNSVEDKNPDLEALEFILQQGQPDLTLIRNLESQLAGMDWQEKKQIGRKYQELLLKIVNYFSQESQS